MKTSPHPAHANASPPYRTPYTFWWESSNHLKVPRALPPFVPHASFSFVSIGKICELHQTKAEVDDLANLPALQRLGAEPLHGGLSQSTRETTLSKFRSGQVSVSHQSIRWKSKQCKGQGSIVVIAFFRIYTRSHYRGWRPRPGIRVVPRAPPSPIVQFLLFKVAQVFTLELAGRRSAAKIIQKPRFARLGRGSVTHRPSLRFRLGQCFAVLLTPTHVRTQLRVVSKKSKWCLFVNGLLATCSSRQRSRINQSLRVTWIIVHHRSPPPKMPSLYGTAIGWSTLHTFLSVVCQPLRHSPR